MSYFETDQLLSKYYSWLRDRTKLRLLDETWSEITTPYLDRHNDHLQILIRRDGDLILLTDDGYIIRDLAASGCKLDSPKRDEILRLTLNGFGVKLEDDALTARALDSEFPQKKHALVQAMLAVNDLFYLASPVVLGLFYEDVVKWLDRLEIRYAKSVKLPGKSGYDHRFDFLIPKSKTEPERLLKAIAHPNRDSAEAFVFSWIDTREARQDDARAYAILNDRDQGVPSTALDAFRQYDVKPVLWSNRDAVRAELAA